MSGESRNGRALCLDETHAAMFKVGFVEGAAFGIVVSGLVTIMCVSYSVIKEQRKTDKKKEP